MKNLIIETTEEYVEEYVRKIDIDHDGFGELYGQKCHSRKQKP